MALEGAIVFLFLFTILAGIVDVSMFFKDTYSVSTAARAGARTASADPLNSNFAVNAAAQAASGMTDLDWHQIIDIWVYKANPTTGATMTGSTCATKCVRFTMTGPTTTTSGAGSWTGRNACISATVDVDSVGVQVRYRHHAQVMFADNQVITERVTMRLEQVPTTQPCTSP